MRQRGGKSGGKCPRTTGKPDNNAGRGGKSGGKRPSASALTQFLCKPGARSRSLSSSSSSSSSASSRSTGARPRGLEIPDYFSNLVTNNPEDDDVGCSDIIRQQVLEISEAVRTTTTTTLSQERRTSCHHIASASEAPAHQTTTADPKATAIKAGPAVMRTKRAKHGGKAPVRALSPVSIGTSGPPALAPALSMTIVDDGSDRPIAKLPWERCKQCSDASNRSLLHCFKHGHLQRDSSISYEQAIRMRAEQRKIPVPRATTKQQQQLSVVRKSTGGPPAVVVSNSGGGSAKRQRTIAITDAASSVVPVPAPLNALPLVPATEVQPLVHLPTPVNEEVTEERRMQQAVAGLLLALQSVAACWPLNVDSALPIGVELLRTIINYNQQTRSQPVRPDSVAQLMSVVEQLVLGVTAEHHRLQTAVCLGSSLRDLGPDASITGVLRVVQLCDGLWTAEDKVRLLSVLQQQLGP